MVALRTFVFRVAVAAAALLALAQADSGVKVHVMSFNVRTSYASGDAASTCSNWNGVRKNNVVKQITNVMPDFFGTQETSDEQKAYLDSQLAGKYLALGTATGSLNGAASEIDALYYKVSDWAVITSGTFWYGPNTEAPSAAWNMKYYRTAVWARFTHIASGQTACIFNTHYETPGNDEAQLQASTILLAKLDALCQAGDKIKVVTGDFNALPNYPAILKLLANGLTESSNEFTFCGDMMSPTCQTKFDYTLHRLSNGACHVKSEVLRSSFDGCYPSDHAVLMGTFCFGGACCNGDSSSSSSGSLNSSTSTNSTTTGSGGSSVAGDSLVLGTVNAGGSKASAGSTAGGGTTVITTKSEESSSATGTVFAIIGVIAATAGIAFFVVRKKKQLDARIDETKSAAVPMPSYFSRADDDAGSEALSPLPAAARLSAPSPGRMSNSPSNRSSGRMSNSPVPTLMATKRDSRDSRSSSVSCKDLSPSYQRNSRGRNTSGASSNFRMSSPVVMMDTNSNYSSSMASYDSRMQDSRIHFSEAYVSESYDSDEDSGALTKKSSTDFAML